MSKITLHQGLQEHIENVSLSDEQLDELIQLQNTVVPKSFISTSKITRYSKITKISGIAATVLIAAVIGLFYSTQQTPIGEKIAHEVSKNHLKLKPLEVNSNKLQDLNEYFTMLDFKLVSSKILIDPNWVLLGGRYCTIQGNTAAQLRIKNLTTGKIETLYQAPFFANQYDNVPSIDKGQTPIEEYSKGMQVKIWTEKGVLFALTNNNYNK